jgi:hypothetical protein
VVQGALSALTSLGLTAGIYSSRHEWGQVMNGYSYSPTVPEWVANWNYRANPSTVCNPSFAFASGPVWMVQYTDSASGGYDGDYAC